MEQVTPFPTFDELLVLRAAARGGRRGLFVDVGAHVGRYAEAMNDLGWKVIAYEPAPDVFVELDHRLGDRDDVELRPVAVAAIPAADIPFYVNEVHWGTSSLRGYLPTHSRTVDVPVVRLDDELAARSVRDERLIVKIDAEGADFDALRGLDVEKWSPEIVMVEFADERTAESWGYTLADMVDHMAQRGYGAIISEWGSVEEHSRPDRASAPYAHLGISRWPVHRPVAWGNALFVPRDELDHVELAAVRVLEQHVRSRALHERELVAAARTGAGAVRLRSRVDELESAIAQRDARASTMREAIGDRDRRVDELERAVHQRRARTTELEAVVRARTARVDELTRVASARDDRIRELGRAIAGRDARIAELGDAIESRDARIAELEGALGRRDRRIDELRRANAAQEAESKRLIRRRQRDLGALVLIASAVGVQRFAAVRIRNSSRVRRSTIVRRMRRLRCAP